MHAAANEIAPSRRFLMARQITTFDAAVGRPDQLASPSRARRAERPAAGLEELIRRAIDAGLPHGFGIVCVWLRRQRHRRELAGLSEAQLLDAGLDPAVVRRERAKPFWQV